MKTKENRIRERENEQPGRGFTIIETLIALLLIALALVLVSNIIVSAVGVYKKSHLRLQAEQEIGSCKNRLLSGPFDSVELQEGHYLKEDSLFKMKWDIKSITPTLKLINIAITYKYNYYRLTRKTYFYKSKYINTSNTNNNNTSTNTNQQQDQ
jgi:prepilin-type N-terminal cleavage/methylation domain-containing protein